MRVCAGEWSGKHRDDDPLAPMERDDFPSSWEPGLYEVERILKAEKRSGIWYVTVKWEGWTRPTEEPRRVLLDGAKGSILEACARAQMKNRTVQTESQEEYVSSDSSDEEEELDEDDNGMYLFAV